MASETQAKRLLSVAHARLAALPNVVGIGVVPAESDPSRSVLAVYVSTKVPRRDLKPDEIVPDKVEAVVDGIRLSAPTRVIAVGALKI